MSKNRDLIDPIAETLDITPVNHQVIETDSDKVDDDFEFTRKNLIDIINVGTDALNDLVDVAKTAESAGFYEVLANQINTLVNANKELLELSKKKETIRQMQNKGKGPANVTNNNLFVGSTTELLELIKKEQ